MNSKYSIHYNKIIHSIHKYIHNNITGNSSAAQLKPCSEHNLPMVNNLPMRFLVHSYCNQKMCIKWNAAISGSFDTNNGVK